MSTINRLLATCAIFSTLLPVSVMAQDSISTVKSKLTIGGYGEAVYNYNFYSDNVFRYRYADRYKDAPGHGRIDLPHAVVMLGYDFGKGWTVGTEIEFEHGGIEAAIEKETEETGEFEHEIERGGEVTLEQFWVQKSFSRGLNLRMGHIVVPVGMTNNNHTPNQFFGVYRPEGENTIIPCTWHETGVSLWGRTNSWRYEIQLLPSLNSNLFTEAGWVHNGSASPYEFRPANSLATAARIDFTKVKGLRLSLSGYIGNSFVNDIVTGIYPESSRYFGANGTVVIGAFDFAYRNRWLTVRGNFDIGYLGDASLISTRNKNQTTMSGNPYAHSAVGQNAWDASIETGINLLSTKHTDRQFYIFCRYDHYDSFIPAAGWTDIEWTERQIVSVGANYYPLPEIAIKAEAGIRLLAEQYNSEPFATIGITWCGFFKH